MKNNLKHIIILNAILLMQLTNIYSQSRKEASQFHNWIAKQNLTFSKQEPCDMKNGTGPFDPTDCIKQELRDLGILKAQINKSNKEITIIVDKEMERLKNIQGNWAMLSQQEKSDRVKTYKNFIKIVEENNGDFSKTFKQRMNNEKSSKEDKDAVNTISRWSDTDGCISAGCNCCCPEGCLCCKEHIIFTRVFGSRTL